MRQEASKWLAFTIISYLRLHLPWCIANIILNQPIAEWDELHSKEREVSFSCFSRKWNEQKYSSFGGTTSSIMHCANHLEPTNKNEMTNGNVATRWKLMAYGQFRTTTPMITCAVHIISCICIGQMITVDYNSQDTLRVTQQPAIYDGNMNLTMKCTLRA